VEDFVGNHVSIDRIYMEELIQLPSESGSYSYYCVEKNKIPISSVRESMASYFDVTPSAVVFPSVRSFNWSTKQYASVRKQGPDVIKEVDYTAKRIQHGSRKLKLEDLSGNRYTVQLNHIPINKVSILKSILKIIEVYGLANYFGLQRFNTMTKAGFIGKAIIKHQAEKAVRFYLAEPQLKDTESLRKFKALVKSHWGQWGYLLHKAPRPSNYLSVITYLKDHPNDFWEAINLVRDQRLSDYLVSYQSWIWNQVLAQYLREKGNQTTEVNIAGTSFPLLDLKTQYSMLRHQALELPRLTSYYHDDFRNAVNIVMAKENLQFDEFDIRLLRRACLVKEERAIWFAPKNLVIGESRFDENAPNRKTLTVTFDLDIQQYTTLVINAAFAYAKLHKSQ
jgi:TruD family tRNA pseudouridine synthase